VTETYGADLAYVHDRGFGGFAASVGADLLALFARRRSTGGLVVDLGCGSGIWARALLEAGYDVLGVDVSPAMLALARRQAPGAVFREASFLDVDLPPCMAVTSMGECLCYTFDGRLGPSALAELFGRCYAAVQPGGLFVFDVVTDELLRPGLPRQAFSEGPDWTCLVDYDRDRDRGLLTRRIITFRLVDGTWRRSVEVHRQTTYRPSTLVGLLRSVGFTARVVRTFGAYSLPPGRAGFIATRRAHKGSSSR